MWLPDCLQNVFLCMIMVCCMIIDPFHRGILRKVNSGEKALQFYAYPQKSVTWTGQRAGWASGC